MPEDTILILVTVVFLDACRRVDDWSLDSLRLFEVLSGSCEWRPVVYCVIDTPTVSVIAAPTQA